MATHRFAWLFRQQGHDEDTEIQYRHMPLRQPGNPRKLGSWAAASSVSPTQVGVYDAISRARVAQAADVEAMLRIRVCENDQLRLDRLVPEEYRDTGCVFLLQETFVATLSYGGSVECGSFHVTLTDDDSGDRSDGMDAKDSVAEHDFGDPPALLVSRGELEEAEPVLQRLYERLSSVE